MISLNGIDVEVTKFPDGTSQVWKLPNIPLLESNIEWNFQHEGEIMYLAQLVHLLRTEGTHKFIFVGQRREIFANLNLISCTQVPCRPTIFSC